MRQIIPATQMQTVQVKTQITQIAIIDGVPCSFTETRCDMRKIQACPKCNLTFIVSNHHSDGIYCSRRCEVNARAAIYRQRKKSGVTS